MDDARERFNILALPVLSSANDLREQRSVVHIECGNAVQQLRSPDQTENEQQFDALDQQFVRRVAVDGGRNEIEARIDCLVTQRQLKRKNQELAIAWRHDGDKHCTFGSYLGIS